MLLKLLLLNIGMLFHSRHSFDIETTWRRLQDMSWRCPRHVFSGTIFRLARRLEDVLKMPWRHLEDISQGVLQDENLYAEDVFKTSSKHILKRSWRHGLKISSRSLGGKQNVSGGYLYLTNLNLYLTNQNLTNLYLTNLWQI